jgi:hypothetical protein
MLGLILGLDSTGGEKKESKMTRESKLLILLLVI